MKFKVFSLLCLGFSLAGCGVDTNKIPGENLMETTSNNLMETTHTIEGTTGLMDGTTNTENTTKSPISNNINSALDGYGMDNNIYNYPNYTYGSNSRFGIGMKGAENIKGNEEKTLSKKISYDINKVSNKVEDMIIN